MDRYLITHSLLSSWLYAIKENPYEDATTERDPMEEFMLALRKEPTPITMKKQNGIDFENLVTAILSNQSSVLWHKYHKKTEELLGSFNTPVQEHIWYEAAAKIARHVQGGIAQCKARKEISVSGTVLLLYGRLDWLKAGEIIDVKFSSKYEHGKYISGTQHPTYLELVTEARKFTYLVSNGSEVWSETYQREEVPSIFPVISDFLSWLTVMGLLDLYKEKWLAA